MYIHTINFSCSGSFIVETEMRIRKNVYKILQSSLAGFYMKRIHSDVWKLNYLII
jgi:hypothetical protein